MLKVRHGSYRLMYCYLPQRDTIYIVAIGHRDQVYRKFIKRLK